MGYNFKYKIGQKVLLRDDAEHFHQKELWTLDDIENYGVIKEAYMSSRQGGPWYRIKAVSGYGNSYPEDELDPFIANNMEAKKLLSKEW